MMKRPCLYLQQDTYQINITELVEPEVVDSSGAQDKFIVFKALVSVCHS